MDFIRNWGHISCHFLLELHPWPVFSIHVRMAKLFIRHKLHLSDNTVAKHVEMLQRFSLLFWDLLNEGSLYSWCQKIRCCVRYADSVTRVHMIWKKDTCKSSFYSRPTTYSPQQPRARLLCYYRMSLSLQKSLHSKVLFHEAHHYYSDYFHPATSV